MRVINFCVVDWVDPYLRERKIARSCAIVLANPRVLHTLYDGLIRLYSIKFHAVTTRLNPPEKTDTCKNFLEMTMSVSP